jgi:hypothetical protein
MDGQFRALRPIATIIGEAKTTIHGMAETQSSEHAVRNNGKCLIVSFGGLAGQMGKIYPYEFLRYLSAEYSDAHDLLFYIDKAQCWYQKGIDGISTGIDDTVAYISSKMQGRDYEQVIFIGTSAGGYAAILFGSLCQATHVLAFIPQTTIAKPSHQKYGDLRPLLNSTTSYTVYGDPQVTTGLHNYRHCARLVDEPNVRVVGINGLDLPTLRDTGALKNIFDNVLQERTRDIAVRPPLSSDAPPVAVFRAVAPPAVASRQTLHTAHPANTTMRVLFLVIASHSDHYDRLREQWEHHLRSWPANTDVLFLYGDPTLTTEHTVVGHDLTFRMPESYIPGLFRKTMRALRLLPLRQYDWVVRTNLSTIFRIKPFLRLLSTLDQRQAYASSIIKAPAWPQLPLFPVGFCIVLPTRAAQLVSARGHAVVQGLHKAVPKTAQGVVDDVLFGVILSELKIPLASLAQHTANVFNGRPEKTRLAGKCVVRCRSGGTHAHRSTVELPVWRRLTGG